VSAEHGDRDLTLRGEITYRAARSAAAAPLPQVNLVVLSARDIALLTVSYVRTPTATPTPTPVPVPVPDPAPVPD
jgi:hypothetical protein